MQKILEYIGSRPMSYRTRRLTAGDTITCSDRDARVWLATRKFRKARRPADIPPPPAELLARFDHDGDGVPGGSAAPVEDVASLRKEYFEKLGKRPFPGWNAETLREKIAAA